MYQTSITLSVRDIRYGVYIKVLLLLTSNSRMAYMIIIAIKWI